MKNKILCTILTLCIVFGCTSIQSNAIYNKDFYITQANAAYEKKLISDKDLEIFKKELCVDILSVDYGDSPVYYSYDLNMLGLLNVADHGYRLGETPTRREGIKMAAKLFGLKQDSESSIYNHPFTDVPKELNAYVGYAYTKGLIDSTENNLFSPNKIMSYDEYMSMILRGLGYKKNIDFNLENIGEIAIKLGLPRAPYEDESFLRAKMININKDALNKKFKNSDKKLITKLLEDGTISKEAFDLLDQQEFERHFRNYRDLTSKTMWKYYKKYDFVSFSNFRTGSAPVSKMYTWPGKDIKLKNAGRIRISKDSGEETYYDIVKNILLDLEIDESQVENCMKDLKEKGESKYSEYCKRVIEIYDSTTYIHIGFYLDFE
ncbi:S-layer homology domain-containing protein [Maledivibacter halophilus]|uniref:SLH domain-containing protein n=1 Tax=Maledivibacter halophilus TaxID=36842 RepID=A0A1T5IUD6_9FIRM|nr:S-layer homology domain-containing protein [Maledivibacter halophilus]SKC42770.1 hypothetical protein SAMN02194393_00754 [Maledivibacter halophilus]